MLIILSLIVLILLLRIAQVYLFIYQVSKLCHIYDRNYINENGDQDISIILDYIKKDYHLNAKWSAYDWMFFKGPNPCLMVFSLKPFTIEKQYGIKIVNKLIEYKVFEDYEWEKQNK